MHAGRASAAAPGAKLPIRRAGGNEKSEARGTGRGNIIGEPHRRGRLDLFLGGFADCPGRRAGEKSRLFHNETPGDNWLGVRVEGKRMNRMGVVALVRIYAAGPVGEKSALLGCQTVTLNGGYSMHHHLARQSLAPRRRACQRPWQKVGPVHPAVLAGDGRQGVATRRRLVRRSM